MPTLVLALSAGLADGQQSVVATGGANQPVRIDLGSFEFEEPFFGREGLVYFATKSEPARGARQFAEARLSGQAGASTVRFEAIDASGNALGVLYLFKLNDALDDDDYAGFVDVPNQPFRVMISGQDADGAPYSRVYDHLFRPRAALLRRVLPDEERRHEAEFDARRRANPAGVIVLPHMEVTHVVHEPYRSASGNTLGIRLSYDIRFSTAAVYAVTPSIDPFFEDLDFRGSVSMKVAQDTIVPMPERLQQQYPPGFHSFVMPARYQSGVVYHFVVDLVPDYAIENAAGTSYCIFSRRFQNSPRLSGVWEALKTQDVPVKYAVRIPSVNFFGEIPGVYSQRAFYEGYTREGAQDCGAMPSFNF